MLVTREHMNHHQNPLIYVTRVSIPWWQSKRKKHQLENIRTVTSVTLNISKEVLLHVSDRAHILHDSDRVHNKLKVVILQSHDDGHNYLDVLTE